jgi:hypothetical protein
VSFKGLTGIDKSLADLAVNREAAQQFPSSKVVDGEILPPKMHHGLGDRLKSIGRTAVLGMGDIARSNPNASTGQLLGAGAAGAATGGVSPVTGDAMLRRAQVQQQEGDVGRQLDIAKDNGQVNAINAEPGLKAEKIRVDQEIANQKAAQEAATESDRTARADAATKASALRDAELARHHKENERLGGIRANKMPTTRGEETPQQYRSRLGQYRAATKELNDLTAQEQDAARRKDAAYARASSLKNWMNSKTNDEQGNPVYGADVTAAEEAARAAENRWQSYAEKLTGAKAKLVQYGDVDESGNPSEPKQAAPQTVGPSPAQPETRKGSITKAQQQLWLSHNPGKSLDDMKVLYPNAVMVN